MKKVRRPKLKKQPRPLPTEKERELQRNTDKIADKIEAAKKGYFLRTSELRQSAAGDYITNPDSISIERLWERDDRAYKRTVSIRTFKNWAVEDDWARRREQFWQEIEARIIESHKHRILVRRLQEIDELTEVRDYMSEYLVPLKDENGQVRRHADGDLKGLPMYGLKMPSLDRFMKAFIELDKELMLKRGEATSRTDNIGEDGEPVLPRVNALDPVAQRLNLSREDMHMLAKALLHRRQPELLLGIGEQVAEEEDDDGDEDE